MKNAFLTCLLLPAWLGCAKPCEVCPNLAGGYTERMARTTVGESSCDTIYSTGGTMPVVLEQQGSRISALTAWGNLTGTLFDDLGLQFDEFSSRVIPEDGSAPIPIKVLLSGMVQGTPGNYSFNALYQATAPSTDCVTRVATYWFQVSP